MKKSQYQLNSVFDLRILGEVPFSINLKNLRWQEHSSLNFQTTLAKHIY